MGIIVKIHNVKNIDDFEFEVPVEKGLYALTGENGSGKSTVISCVAAAFYVPSFEDYFGNPREDAYIEFISRVEREVLEKKVVSGKIRQIHWELLVFMKEVLFLEIDLKILIILF